MEEQIKYKVFDAQGKELNSIHLDARVFGASMRKHLIHDCVVWQRNLRRAGTHSTLSKGVMKGGGKKPWRQKGTGRARAGSNTSPLWVGGAVAHGPKPRSYESRLAKRNRREALFVALSEKVRQNKLLVVDQFVVSSSKTKEAKQLLNRLGVRESALVMFSKEESQNGKSPTWLAMRNLPAVTPVSLEGLNVYDLLKCDYLMCSSAALGDLQKSLAAKANNRKAQE